MDDEHCGPWGAACAQDERCTLGVCLPKVMTPCDLACGEGEGCCWVLGDETCVDVTSSEWDCGGCGNVCPFGTACQAGVCEAWYDVYDPCLGSEVNCGMDGEVRCARLEEDADDCGACGFECPDDAWCEDGHCVVAGRDDEVTND